MRKMSVYMVLIIALCGLVFGYRTMLKKGDYILEKEINSNNISTITVVHNISKWDAITKSVSDYLKNDDNDDVMIYHVNDTKLYSDLDIGERVTVKAGGYTMQSNPPQEVAKEIVRYKIRK